VAKPLRVLPAAGNIGNDTAVTGERSEAEWGRPPVNRCSSPQGLREARQMIGYGKGLGAWEIRTTLEARQTAGGGKGLAHGK